MIKIPKTDTETTLNLSYGTNTSFYSGINFIFSYIKDGILEQLFTDGKDTFGEIITNYARPELRNSEIKDERDTKLATPSNFCSLNLVVDYNDTTFVTMQNFDSPFGFGSRSNLFNTILQDNLFTLGFNTTPIKMNLDINIVSSDKLRLTNYAGFIKQRLHIGKFFRLTDIIPLKFVLDAKLIGLIKLLYPEITDLEFESRLNRLTNNNVFREIDKTTGNYRYFVNIATRPLLKLTSIDDTDNLRISLEINTYLPSKFHINTIVTLEELSDLVITKEMVTTTDVPPEDLDKLLNFSPRYIATHRDKFSFSDEDFNKILAGTLYPIVKLQGDNLTQEEVAIIGNLNEGKVNIEDIRIRLEEQVTNTDFISSVSNIVSNDLSYEKISSLIITVLTFNDSNGNSSSSTSNTVVNIDDSLFVRTYIKYKDNIKFVCKIGNKIVYPVVTFNIEKNYLEFTFDSTVAGQTLNVTLFKSKYVV